jgi:subtilase family serine protease
MLTFADGRDKRSESTEEVQMRGRPSSPWCHTVTCRTRTWTAAATVLAVLAGAPAARASSVDYGPISHKGYTTVGAASTSLKLPLQIGLIANQSGLQSAVKAASNPASSSYGKYPSLSTLASKYGASSSKRNGVVNAFKSNGITATVDVTHLRVTATVSVSKAQKMFGTKWNVYKTGSGSKVALPVDTPKLPSGINGNVDTVAGMNVQLSSGGSSSAARAAVVADGGTPTRTGTPAFGCVPTMFPSALDSTGGLYPNQILTAYGIAPLQAAGLKGQGAGVAILGEAPTPAADVNTFRSCFGAGGTGLKIHNAGSIKPILESSLDAMTVAMVAPALSRFDLWVHPISDIDDFLALLAQPLQATTNGTPLPDVISVSYGECESVVQPSTASRTLVERQLTATAALGITTVVAAGDSGSSACARGVSANDLTSDDEKPQVDWPASSPWVLSVGGTNLTLNADNTIASSGAWNDTAYPSPFKATAGGGGGSSAFETRPWWQPAQSFAASGKRMVPDIAAFADESPGYPIVCSSGVQGCKGSGQTIAFVGGTSAAAPLVAGMIALWNQQAHNQGLPRPGFVAPLLTTLAQHSPQAFTDITQGTNALFGGSCCPTRTGYDLATGWGSPSANLIASLLPH